MLEPEIPFKFDRTKLFQASPTFFSEAKLLVIATTTNSHFFLQKLSHLFFSYEPFGSCTYIREEEEEALKIGSKCVFKNLLKELLVAVLACSRQTDRVAN